MQTSCPSCRTIFRLTEAQAAAAGGEVRCGVCRRSFNAYDERIDVPPPRRTIKSLLTEKSRALAAREHSAILQAPKAARRRVAPLWSTVLWAGLILLVVAVGLAQLAWYHRLALAGQDRLAPWVALACESLPCNLPPRADLARIELLSRDVREHPTVDGALLITATLVNRADFEQPWPRIGVALSSLSGRVVARREFTPAEYLPDDAVAAGMMARGSPVNMLMEALAPSAAFVSYRFEFLPAPVTLDCPPSVLLPLCEMGAG